MMVLVLLGSIGLICSGCWLWLCRNRGIGVFFGVVGALYTVGALVKMANGAG